MNKFFYSIIIVLFVAILVVVLVAKNRKDKNKYAIKTVKPVIMTIENKRLISGNIYPLREIDVKSQISGIIDEINVKTGELVKIGQPLAKIKIVSDPKSIEQAKKNFETAKIYFKEAKQNYNRINSLYKNNVVALIKLEQAKRSFDLCKKELNSSENQLMLLKNGYLNNSSKVSSIVTATLNGTVINLPLKKGSSVIERNNFSAGTTIATIANLNSFIFRGKVLETDLQYLYIGKKIELVVNAIKNTRLQAEICDISNKGFQEQGIVKFLIEANIILKEKEIQLRSGYSAIAEIIMERKENVLAIEEKNIMFSNDTTYVEIIDNKLPVKTIIQTGVSDGIYIEIIKGLKKKDNIRENIN